MKKIIILDYEDSSVHIFDYDTNVYNDFEEFAESLVECGFNFKSSQCNWMVVDNLNIEIH